MSALPSFDVYEELEVTRSSTSSEITASYRRLALIHHPDKNGNSAEATTKFQRLQASYQTLSDPATRSRYDSQNSSRASTASGGSRYSSWEDRGYDSADEFDPDLNGWSYSRPGGGGGGSGGFPGFSAFEDLFNFARSGGWHFYDGSDRGSDYEALRRAEVERMARESAAYQEQREKERRELQEQERVRRREREEADAKKKAEKEEADRKFKEELQIKVDNKRKVELDRQQRIWEAHKAVTPEQQQRFCDHADFWDKVQSEKKGEKLKCGICKQRRGMTSFQCPYCELIACQVCLNKFNKKRKNSGLFGKS